MPPTSPRRAVRRALASVLAALALARASALPSVMNSVALRWDFRDGASGWAQSTSLEMGLQVDAAGGALRGVALASGRPERAFVDSPQLRVHVSADDRDVLVLRMRALGQCALAMVALERDAADPATDRRERVALHDPVRIPFALHGSGASELYYVPVWRHVTGAVHRVRLHPCVQAQATAASASVSAVQPSGQSFELDWVAFAKAPVIAQVRGCLDQYFDYEYADADPGGERDDRQQQQPLAATARINASSARTNCSERVAITNRFLASSARVCSPLTSAPPPPAATTYNCARGGGERLVITGRHFGAADAVVTVGGVACLDVVHVVPEVEIHCRLPPAAPSWRASPAIPSRVRVQLGALPGLFDEALALAYAAPVATPLWPPVVSNVAARALDVNWAPPASVWDAMTVSGYRVAWRKCHQGAPDFSPADAVDVGNVTHTTLLGLEAATGYQVRVTPLTEGGQREVPPPIDLYGRLETALHPDTVAGEPSPASPCVFTLPHDISFPTFSARLLTNQSALLAAPRTPPTRGPSGEIGDQGHFGLYVNGDAHVENANGSVSCCDGFNAAASAAQSPTAPCTYVAASTAADTLPQEFVNGVTDRSLPTNAPFARPFPTKRVFDARAIAATLRDALDAIGAAPVTAACGPALRLTGSHARLAGSAWYPRRMNVREGFETSFSFRLANPSTRCRFQDRVHSRCRARGGDGLAFVVQNDHAIALGGGRGGLGYGGLRNALAVEFDSWFNHELLDAYENQVSVHLSAASSAEGGGAGETQHHSRSLGSSTRVSDLAQGSHRVRITYSPNIGAREQQVVFSEAFAASALAGDMFASGAWATGVGLLAVYVDDWDSPALAVPLRLERSLELFHGRAWVGFTAATGAEAWQTHDLLDWAFDSLRSDVRSIPALHT